MESRFVFKTQRSGAVVSHISRKTSEMWGTRGFVGPTGENRFDQGAVEKPKVVTLW
jgi:hypothetical protein